MTSSNNGSVRASGAEAPEEHGNACRAGWELFSHDADIGVRGRGATSAEAFEQAALAMTAAITNPGKVELREAVAIQCSAPDLETLLVDWLNQLVLEMAIGGLLFGKFDVAIDGVSLHATAWGEPAVPEKHEPATEVKGATFTALSVAADEHGCWQAQCVVDV